MMRTRRWEVVDQRLNEGRASRRLCELCDELGSEGCREGVEIANFRRFRIGIGYEYHFVFLRESAGFERDRESLLPSDCTSSTGSPWISPCHSLSPLLSVSAPLPDVNLVRR